MFWGTSAPLFFWSMQSMLPTCVSLCVHAYAQQKFLNQLTFAKTAMQSTDHNHTQFFNFLQLRRYMTTCETEVTLQPLILTVMKSCMVTDPTKNNSFSMYNVIYHESQVKIFFLFSFGGHSSNPLQSGIWKSHHSSWMHLLLTYKILFLSEQLQEWW
jgi:hypothetical protein